MKENGSNITGLVEQPDSFERQWEERLYPAMNQGRKKERRKEGKKRKKVKKNKGEK